VANNTHSGAKTRHESTEPESHQMAKNISPSSSSDGLVQNYGTCC